MRAVFALLLFAVCCVPVLNVGINPDGIESGLAEVIPLSTNTALTITWNDPGITTAPYFAMAIAEMESSPQNYYQITLTPLALTATSASYNVTLVGGWVKLVYRWIASKGEPLIATMITLGSTASGNLNVPLPFGLPTTFASSSVERVDTLIAAFDYTNPGTFTGLDIQIKPVVSAKNPTFDDFTTAVNGTSNALIPQPITTVSGVLTLNVQITILGGATLNSLTFAVILHTIVQSTASTLNIATGYALPVATQSAVFGILNEARNRLSVINPQAIYGASVIYFPDNSPNGIGFRIDLPQAQTASVTFPASATRLETGIYMYAVQNPCGAVGGNITSQLQTNVTGSWTLRNNPLLT